MESTISRTYTCEGCSATFTGTAEEAFNLGWDTPERFLSHCTCPHCPITCTAWWKTVVEKKPLTEEEVALIASYNEVFFDVSVPPDISSLDEGKPGS